RRAVREPSGPHLDIAIVASSSKPDEPVAPTPRNCDGLVCSEPKGDLLTCDHQGDPAAPLQYHKARATGLGRPRYHLQLKGRSSQKVPSASTVEEIAAAAIRSSPKIRPRPDRTSMYQARTLADYERSARSFWRRAHRGESRRSKGEGAEMGIARKA